VAAREALEAELRAAERRIAEAEDRVGAAEDRASAAEDREAALGKELEDARDGLKSIKEETAAFKLLKQPAMPPQEDASCQTPDLPQDIPEAAEAVPSPRDVPLKSSSEASEQVEVGEAPLLRERIETLDLQLAQAQREALESRSQLERERAERRGSETELQRQIDRLESRSSAAASELPRLRFELARAEEARESAGRFVQDLQGELNRAESSISLLASRLDRMEMEAAASGRLPPSAPGGVSSTLCDEGVQTDHATSQTDGGLLEEATAINGRLVRDREEMWQLEQHLAALRHQVSEREDALRAEEARLRGALARSATAVMSAEAAEAHLEHLERRATAARATADVLAVDLGKAGAEISALSAELGAAERHFRDVKASMGVEIEELHDMRVGRVVQRGAHVALYSDAPLMQGSDAIGLFEDSLWPACYALASM